MVISHNFQEIIDALPKLDSFSLPAYKQIQLNIVFEKVNQRVERVYNGAEPPLPFACSDIFYAYISYWRRLTVSEYDCKTVYEITLDVTDSNFKFKAGDTIGVIPHNDEADVNFIISHLDLDTTVDDCYTLSINNSGKGSKIPVHVPIKSTLRHVLTHCLDLRSVIKKLFLLALSKYTKDDKERNLLQFLCSKEGASAYTTHILNKKICLIDLLTIFKTCKPPVEVLLTNLPRLIPRPYSIVNSSITNSEQIKICFSVMTINNRKGLTTGWLESIILNEESTLEGSMQNLSISEKPKCKECKEKVPIYLRKNVNGFAMPEDLEKPLILIGPGTGISPYIGFLEEREYAKNACPQTKLAEAWLFFGCRNPELDFIYKKELDGFLSQGILTKLSTAFSRVDNYETKYIQDSLKQNGKELTLFINFGAAIFISGDLHTMASEIKDIVVKCFIEYDNLSEEEAKKKICDMEKEKRYFVDAWS